MMGGKPYFWEKLIVLIDVICPLLFCEWQYIRLQAKDIDNNMSSGACLFLGFFLYMTQINIYPFEAIVIYLTLTDKRMQFLIPVI